MNLFTYVYAQIQICIHTHIHMNHKRLLNLFKGFSVSDIIGFSSTDIPHQHNVVTILPLELLKIIKLLKCIILDEHRLLLAPGLFTGLLFVCLFCFWSHMPSEMLHTGQNFDNFTCQFLCYHVLNAADFTLPRDWGYINCKLFQAQYFQMGPYFSVQSCCHSMRRQPSCPHSTSFTYLSLNVQNIEFGGYKKLSEAYNYNRNFTDGHSQARIYNLEPTSPTFS